MSSELTDKAIDSAKRSEELSSKPVLSTAIFIENVQKLKNHFDEIETFRAQVKEAANQERILFAEAKTKLEGIKTISKTGQDEFVKEISKPEESPTEENNETAI